MEDRNEPTWIMNPYGVKSCIPKWLAQEQVSTMMGFKYCDPDDVPLEKVFPTDDLGLTERGKRDRAQRKKNEEEKQRAVEMKAEGEYTLAELRAMAKKKGINSFGKRVSELRSLLGV